MINAIIQGLVYGLVRCFVRPKIISQELISASAKLPDLNFCYIIPYRSLFDRMILKMACRRLQLQQPNQYLLINQKAYQNTFALTRAPHLSLTKKQHKQLFAQFEAYSQIEQPEKVLFIPMNIMFGRAAYKKSKPRRTNAFFAAISKLNKIIFSGRRCFILFSKPILLSELIDYQKITARKDSFFFRLAKLHFVKQYTAFVGPITPRRKVFLNQLLEQPQMKQLIQDEAELTHKPIAETRKEAMKLLDEIAADYRYGMLKLTDIVLTFAWHKLYQGLNVSYAEKVREIAAKGHEIIFAPCHRSHMDYLLLSYVLYQQALVPPHIAAGVNLNFWPAGPIFRRLGAFFIRRTFRGSKLYTVIFREYLAALFKRGSSVEYFMEGGRSRTGRLLDPKTGLLLMTVQTLLRENSKPITIIPVYIGYEHVVEVKTYERELNGATKKHENIWQMLRGFSKLKKLGFGYVNFGEPIQLHSFLTQIAPDWQNDRDKEGLTRPTWLTPTVNQLSNQIMENINKAAAINAMNLCSLILLSSQNKMSKETLLSQFSLHLQILKSVPYSKQMTLPTETVEQLFDHVCEMNKLSIKTDESGNEQISLLHPEDESYYRNNIQHLFVVPSLITLLLREQKVENTSQLIDQVNLMYPFLKGEFFLSFDEDKLLEYVESYLEYLTKHHDFKIVDSQIQFNAPELDILADHVVPSLVRYYNLVQLLDKTPELSRGALEKQWRESSIKNASKISLPTLDMFDKTLYAQIVTVLKDENYFEDETKRSLFLWLLTQLLNEKSINKENLELIP